MKKDYYLIDILKVILAIFVVGIHTNIVSDYNNDAQWYIYTMLFRLGVPFFFLLNDYLFLSYFGYYLVYHIYLLLH